jgi:hypothetical protein
VALLVVFAYIYKLLLTLVSNVLTCCFYFFCALAIFFGTSRLLGELGDFFSVQERRSILFFSVQEGRSNFSPVQHCPKALEA